MNCRGSKVMWGRSILTTLGVVSLFLVATGHARAAEPDAKGVQYFEKQIRPVLVEHCYACHSVEAKKAKGGLQLDTRRGLLEGGDTGPAVVPGKPAESLIIKALRHDGLKMPNKDKKLSDDIVTAFETWITIGAPDPREGKSQVQKKVDYVEGRKHWAYQPVQVTPPPKLKDGTWAHGEIDRYVLAQIEAKGLKPAPDATRVAFIRRVTFDLIGLPPTPEEVDAFVADKSPEAYAKVVDRLLESKQFGAHWARHWLDGIRFNPAIIPVDRYRSWVVRAYNDDLPYDQFVLRQLAGDLLPAKDDQTYDSNLTATQLLCMNIREPDLVEAMMEVVGQHFLAVSINCAKCHDHKYDSFAQTDYYAMAGIFASTRIGGFQGRAQLMRKATDTPLRAEPGVGIPAAQDGKKAATSSCS